MKEVAKRRKEPCSWGRRRRNWREASWRWRTGWRRSGERQYRAGKDLLPTLAHLILRYRDHQSELETQLESLGLTLKERKDQIDRMRVEGKGLKVVIEQD